MPKPRPHRDRLRLVRAGLAVLAMTALAALPLTAAGAPAVTTGSAVGWGPAPRTDGGTAVSGSISTVVRDGDDTAGSLDIRSVGSRVDAATGHASRLQYVVRTYEALPISTLHHRWRRLVLELDTDAQPGSERHLVISAREGRLTAQLVSNATRQGLGRLRVSQPSPTVLRVSGSRAELGARKLFWTADWHLRRDSACGDVDGWPRTCQDSVPDDGWLRLDRPAWP